MIADQKKGKMTEIKEEKITPPSHTEKKLILFPLGILFLGFFVLFLSNNETSSKDVEFFHRAKR